MKRRLFLLIALCQAFSSFSQSEIDILHYKFQVNLNDESDTIYGTAEITIRFSQPVSFFVLDLVGTNSRGKGMRVDRVFNTSHKALEFMQQNEKIKIILPKAAKTDDSTRFTISYHGIPSDGLIISKNKYGDRTFFADNWPNRAHNWIPCKDEPNDKATFEFIVTAPSHYEVISNGSLIEKKDLLDNKKLTHWKEDVSLPTKVMVIGVSKFAVKQFADSPPNIPVSAWVYPQDSVTGFRNYSAAPGILKFYSDYVGPYPYNKLANVQSKTEFGGMENASAIFYNEASAEQNNTVEDLLAHEIAHQWFGDMATEKKFSHLWLSEGFATYLTDIYLESRYGTAHMNKLLKEDRNKVIDFMRFSSRPVVDSVSSFVKLLSPNSYERGGWVLHMLRRQLGDSAFQTLIRKYYDRYKGTNADTDDFRQMAGEVSGKNLKQFFKQWLYTPSIPELQIQSKYEKETGELLLTVTQLQKDIFQFPLEFQFSSAPEGTKSVSVQVTKKTETFKFKVAQRLLDFIVDPNTSLLFKEVKK